MAKILYIAGYGRSGSTVLSTVLGNHPQMASLGEVSFLLEDWSDPRGVCSCGRRYPECEFWKDMFEGEGPTPETVRLVRRMERASSLPRLCFGWVSREQRQEYRAHQEQLLDYIAARTDAPVVVDSSKSPRLTVGRLIAMKRLAGEDVYILHLVRNGLATMASLVLTGSNRALEGRTRPLRLPALRAAVGWTWTNLFAASMRRVVGDDHYMLLRYEDFMADPSGALLRIGDFIRMDMGELIDRVERRGAFEVGHMVAGNRVRFQRLIRLRGPDAEHQEELLRRGHRVLFSAIGGRLNRHFGYPRAALRPSPARGAGGQSGEGDPAPLGAAVALLEALHAAGVHYCSWKSNEHLGAGLCGRTDLDLLIDRREYGTMQRILVESGFKRFDATIGLGYAAIEDHIALDQETGLLLHCHAHFRLMAGEEHLKGYRLPWEDRLLATRVWDAERGVYVADPHLEMITLLVRSAIKLRARDLGLRMLGRPYIRKGTTTEFEWLSRRIDRERCRQLCGELLGEDVVPVLTELLDDGLSRRTLVRFRQVVRPRLESLRIYGRFSGDVLRWLREIAWLIGGANRRYLRWAHPLRRTTPGGGVLVALMGSDGSGKSTVVRDVSALFATKVDVFRVYFGSGDGPTSLVRWPLRLLWRAVRPGTSRAKENGAPGVVRHGGNGAKSATGAKGDGLLLSLGRMSWGLALSSEKSRRLRAAWRARNRGMIVVADRYPQAQVLGFNDGPLLSRYAQHSSPLLRWIARHEAAPYHWAERYPPDLVIRLNVTPAVAVERKPEMSVAEVERRTRAVRSIALPPQTQVVDIDADRPIGEVVREVKRLVWNMI
ncbi:MAG TPA: sulfotransferase [Gemmatimonadaceae bacterium]|nr:sulfotransferase [Gemmatimonadaceae bacterium]